MNRRLLAAAAAAASLTLAGGPAAVGQDEVHPPHPVHIHAGLCPMPGDVVRPLSDLVVGTDEGVGAATAAPVEISTSTVDMPLADILAGEHSINAHESGDAMDRYIACGDIGGQMLGESGIAIGLAEQNGSGHHGVAWLQDDGAGGTRVEVFLLTTGAPDGADTSAPPAPDASLAPTTAPAS